VARDSIVLRIEDAEDWATLVEREARERVSRAKAENTTALASAHEDAEGLVRKITLLEGGLVEECRAQELSEENSHGLSDAAADAECRWEVSEMECRVQFKELTLLQTRGSELCLAIIGPPRVRNHLSEGVRNIALHHTEMTGELAMLRAAVSSTAKSALRCSPDEIFHMEVAGELVAKFQRLEERCSRLEQPAVRI
jgi:hypothetical protein